MRRLTMATVAASVGLLLAGPVAVEAQVQVGPYLAYHDDADLGVGGMVAVPLPDLADNLSFVGDVGIFFPDRWGRRTRNVDYWEANADAVYVFPLQDDSVTPWAMAGVNIARWSVGRAGFDEGSRSDTEIGINLGGGVTFGSGPVQPFAGVKVELDGGRGGVLFAGIAFSMGPSGE